MNFIFPQNYDYKYKFLGLFDTATVVSNVFLALFVYFLIKIFSFPLIIKIYIFIITYFPFFLISFIGFNGENIIYVCLYIYKFHKNRKIYLY